MLLNYYNTISIILILLRLIVPKMAFVQSNIFNRSASQNIRTFTYLKDGKEQKVSGTITKLIDTRKNLFISLSKEVSEQNKDYKVLPLFFDDISKLRKFLDVESVQPTLILLIYKLCLFAIKVSNKQINCKGCVMFDMNKPLDVSNLKARLIRMSKLKKVEKECPICFEQTFECGQSYMCHRCGQSICLKCSNKLDKCPMCRHSFYEP